MLRTGASRMGFRAPSLPAARSMGVSWTRKAAPVQWTSTFSSVSFNKRPSARPTAIPPIQSLLLRRTVADKIDREAEKKYQQEKLQPTPESVTPTSTTRPIFGEVGGTPASANDDVDMMAGVKSDVQTIKDTFSLAAVPRQAYYIGLAGVLPYLATSVSTVFCAYNINHAADGMAILLNPATAETLLHILEPIQIGYGAVILSFLGAIHWGLEWAGFGGYQGYKRYAIGVMAPAVAWPTMLLPVETALISQFCAFVFLYYIDTRAAYRGWTPSWYAIYRFVLTFIVGASIVISLIGRGEVAHRVGRLPGAVDKLTQLRTAAQESLAKEEQDVIARKEAPEGEKRELKGSEEED